MKIESLNELQEAVRTLDFTASNLCADNLDDTKTDIRAALEHIRVALFMETPSPSMKFNIYDFTDDDGGIRPVMGCVHHEEGYKVASDSHLLIAVKDDYPEDLEGKNIDKKGAECDDKYPKWKLVFPNREKQKATQYRIDFDKIAGWVKEHNTEKKMKGKWGARKGFVKVGPAFFKLELLARFAKFMKAEGTDILHVEDQRRAAACYAEDGSKGLIMPVMPIDDWEESETAMVWVAA